MTEDIITKHTYLFGCNAAGSADIDPKLLGSKGAGLHLMANLGIAVPPGFTISTNLCNYYYQNNKSLPKTLKQEVEKNLAEIEMSFGRVFGSSEKPLLLSVRSGAYASMPGMMDTILNVGLNDENVENLVKKNGDERFVLDCYRRLIQMYGNVVLKIEASHFEEVIDLLKIEKKYKSDQEFTAQNLKFMISKFKEIVLDESGQHFPQDVFVQLNMAIKAVFDSWMSKRAIIYRKINDISNEVGTAINIQAMVFGNYCSNSGTGVLFTRNPSTGVQKIFGEYLQNAQGEDVVSGVRTPMILQDAVDGGFLPAALYHELTEVADRLETYSRDMQDIEFTIEQGKLWILQTRSAKRTAFSAVKIAVDMVNEGILSKEEAILRIDPNMVNKLLHPAINKEIDLNVFAKGLAASPGAVSGAVVFSAEDAEDRSKREKVILVRQETCPEDIGGMHASEGILTSKGGMTSHAAVVARGMGKACICGASGILIDYESKVMKSGDVIVKEGDIITLNGETGEVIIGYVEAEQPGLSEEFETLLTWSGEIKKLNVRANSETEQDTKTAQRFRAEGIGLCRTEHMFFDSSRINIMRQMILASNKEERLIALAKLEAMQVHDFEEIIRIMDSKPVTIRLLDPPLNEFISNENIHNIEELSKILNHSEEKIAGKIRELSEQNPMLGHRGCRLAVTYPEIYQMQVSAIFTAISKLLVQGFNPIIEIMIPLVISENELSLIRDDILQIADKFNLEHTTHYKIGTMIELPRACIVADKIAQYADFCSFGTNDLTQTVFGISRDDAGSYMSDYLEKNIFKIDPFVEIDREAVGALMKIAIEKIRSLDENIKIGVCGEHGGNPNSIKFFHEIGLDYISCSPFRLPIAIIAAAQAAILAKPK